MKRRIRILLIAAALVVLLPLGAYAVKTWLAPTATGGNYTREIVDRLDVTVTPASFTYPKDTADDALVSAELTITLKKTEPDFYVMLNDLYLDGAVPEQAEFLCETTDFDAPLPGAAALPVKDGAPAALTYRATLVFRAGALKAAAPALVLEYTSGMTRQTADGRRLEIPLEVRWK